MFADDDHKDIYFWSELEQMTWQPFFILATKLNIAPSPNYGSLVCSGCVCWWAENICGFQSFDRNMEIVSSNV
jgi:hypothetical protein